MKVLTLALLIATVAYSGSLRSKPSARASTGWGSAAKRPGSSGSTKTFQPQGMRQEKINTNSLSMPNRSVTPPKVAAPVQTPAPVVQKPAPTLATSAIAGAKINTSSLSDPNRGQPKVSASVAVAAQATPTPAPAQAPTTIVNKTVVVNKTVYTNHHYDNGYRFSPAPVIFVHSRPIYVFHDHQYPIIERNGLYYSNVDGREVEMAQGNGTWGVVEPEPIVTQPTLAPVHVQAPVKEEESSHWFLISLAIAASIAIGAAAYVLIRGDNR